MTDYTELVKALRCETSNGGDCWEKKCQYLVCGSYAYCNSKRIMSEAAAAIEALQAHLPKRGEWIWNDKRCIYVCSVCGLPKVRENMDRQIIKEQAYCYSCGAKMEVQE